MCIYTVKKQKLKNNNKVLQEVGGGVRDSTELPN